MFVRLFGEVAGEPRAVPVALLCSSLTSKPFAADRQLVNALISEILHAIRSLDVPRVADVLGSLAAE